MDKPLGLIAVLDETAAPRYDHVEHGNGGRVLWHR